MKRRDLQEYSDFLHKKGIILTGKETPIQVMEMARENGYWEGPPLWLWIAGILGTAYLLFRFFNF